MRRRTEKVSQWELIVLAVVAVGLFAVLANSQQTARANDYETRFQAAKLCQQAFNAVREQREKLGLGIDEINDPNRTGLVGSQYSLITVGRGDQTGVMTAANPNFAAVAVSLLRKAGLRSGDVVAVGLNGSIPPLNIEALAACRVLGLKPVIISAVGSGMWGATDPQFTWLDMELLLSRQGILPYRSVAASRGGEGDDGRGLSPAGRAWLDMAIARSGIARTSAPSLAVSVQQRMEIYRREAGGQPIKAFINVGNGFANLGESDRQLPAGVLDRRPAQLPDPSVMRSMADLGARLINLNDPGRLAYRYKLPVAPVPLPAFAKGRMYVEKRYPVGLAVVFAVVIIALLFFVIEFDLDYYVRRTLGMKPKAGLGG